MASHHPIPASAPPTPVTVIGLGAMGRALAKALLKAGHPTTVWNRTPGRADDLVALGATAAATAQDAVRAGDLIIVCVVNYDASQAILDPLAEALKGRALVNLTSDLPARARQAAHWAQERSIPYLDGAVSVQESEQKSAVGIQQRRDGGMYMTNAEATAVGAMYVLLDLGRHYLVEQVWLPGVDYVRYQVWYW